jgi:hypothetical protein
MDPARFDRLSKSLATHVSRRRAVRGLGAAGLAGAVLSQHRQDVAADCPDISGCCYGSGSPCFNITGGPYGACWNWDKMVCEPCSTTWAALNDICNKALPDLCRGGKCWAAFPIAGIPFGG